MEFIGIFAKDGPVWALVACCVYAAYHFGKWAMKRDDEARADAKAFNASILETIQNLAKFVDALQKSSSLQANGIANQEKVMEELRILLQDERMILLEIRAEMGIHGNGQERSNAPRNKEGG